MNGQMYQICSIVAAGRKSIQTNKPVEYTPAKYENTITFLPLTEKKLFGTKKHTLPNVSAWFEHIKKRELQDINFTCPIGVDDRGLLGFSNTTESAILCFFKNNQASYFTPDWRFDATKKQWDILYTEHSWICPPSGKPHFENNVDAFRKALIDIKDLATQIECENFAHTFGSAISLLDGSGEYPDEKYGLELPQIPHQNLQLFEAASIADVFGAMGSWNDCPPYMAHEKGLDEEYEKFSAALLKNIRLAIMYAINEW